MGYSEVIMLEWSLGRQLEAGNFHERRNPSWQDRQVSVQWRASPSQSSCLPSLLLLTRTSVQTLNSEQLYGGVCGSREKMCAVAAIRAPVSRNRKCGFWDGYFVISGGLRKSVYYSTEVSAVSVSSGICIVWQQDKVKAPFTDLGFVYGNGALEVWITRFWRLALDHQVAQISTTVMVPACSLPLEKSQLLADCHAGAESGTLQWSVHTTVVFLLRFVWHHSDWIIRFTGFQKVPHRPHFRMGDILGIPKPWIISHGREVKL